MYKIPSFDSDKNRQATLCAATGMGTLCGTLTTDELLVSMHEDARLPLGVQGSVSCCSRCPGYQLHWVNTTAVRIKKILYKQSPSRQASSTQT